MTTVLLTPNGLLQASISQKYRVDDILDLDDPTVKAFAGILHVPKESRYQILYSLAINNLLIVPELSDPLEWIQKRRTPLKLMDETISEGSGFRIPAYDLSFTGKRSSLFRMLSSLEGKPTDLTHAFEDSFHLLPTKFVGSSDKITDPEGYRAKILSAIQPNFALNDLMIEQTFNLIDQLYFSQLLKYRLQAAGKKISFKVSYQMSSSAGNMKSKGKEYIISISSRLTEVLGNKLNSGININGPIDAFIVTLQHEITHLIVHLEMDRLGVTSDNESFKSHGPVFKDIGLRFFGLTERTHSLFEEGEVLTPQVSVNQLYVGQRVYFDPNTTKGQLAGVRRVYGTIKKINPKTISVTTEGHGGWKVGHRAIHPA